VLDELVVVVVEVVNVDMCLVEETEMFHVIVELLFQVVEEVDGNGGWISSIIGRDATKVIGFRTLANQEFDAGARSEYMSRLFGDLCTHLINVIIGGFVTVLGSQVSLVFTRDDK
jgi:hypothetical protein